MTRRRRTRWPGLARILVDLWLVAFGAAGAWYLLQQFTPRLRVTYVSEIHYRGQP